MNNADIDYEEESQMSDKWINLKEVIKVLTKNRVHFYDMVKITSELKELPFVEQEPKYCDRNICIKNEYNGIGCDECEVTKSQEPKTGHWIYTGDYITDGMLKCSECGFEHDVSERFSYCPNCGAKMQEVEE